MADSSSPSSPGAHVGLAETPQAVEQAPLDRTGRVPTRIEVEDGVASAAHDDALVGHA